MFSTLNTCRECPGRGYACSVAYNYKGSISFSCGFFEKKRGSFHFIFLLFINLFFLGGAGVGIEKVLKHFINFKTSTNE